MKKDDYLSTIMQVPPKQHVKITPFDAKTEREAFTVSLEGLKGVCFSLPIPYYSMGLIHILRQWNPSALVLESAQAREDRKKRVSATRRCISSYR